jgi:tetratricopeptide (TPR) repeat protein
MTGLPTASSPVDRMAEGQALLSANNFARSIRVFDDILRANPTHYMATFERARAHQGLGQWEEAVRGYGAALRIDPGEPAAYVNRGTCRANLADHQGAAEDLERFLDSRPQRADVWTDLGDRRLDAGSYARAAEAYERSAALEATRAADLAPWIERARRLDSLRGKDLAAACRERGWAKFEGGGYRTAIQWFNRAIDAFPEDADAWHGRGASRGKLGQTAEALADLEKSTHISGDSAAAWIELGSYRSLQGDCAGALAAADEGIRRAPDASRGYLVRGLAGGKMDKLAEAEADLSRCIDLAPKEALGWINRGWIRRRAGRFKEAVDDLTNGIALDPTWALAFSNRGYARQELGDKGGAGEDFKQAMALDPSLAPELTPLIQAAPPSGPTPKAPPAVPVRAAPAPASSQAETPKAPSEFIVILVFILVVGGLGVLRIPYLSGIPARALDIPYKAAWIVAHWTDEVAFPPESHLCMEVFCTRTDVKKKYVCGRPRYTSETNWRYCPAHEPSLFATGSRLDGMIVIVYFGLSVVAGVLWVVALLSLLVRIALLPFLGPLVLAGKLPRQALFPFGADAETRLGKMDAVLGVGSLALFAVMLLINLIW